MEKTNTKSWIRSVRLFKRLFHSLNNLTAKTKDVDFKEFSLLEYTSVQIEDIKDLKRLQYIERLQLAEKGYINKDLKNHLNYFKEKDRVLHQGHNIVPIGNINITEGENLIGLLQMGFATTSKTFVIATRNHENIPLWQDYDTDKVVEFVSGLHPSASPALRFKHHFLGTEVLSRSKEDLDVIHTFYNSAVQNIFQSNAYFRKAILVPNENQFSEPGKYLDYQFLLPIDKGEHAIMTLTEATKHYLVFESFLTTAPRPEAFYFGRQEFKERFLDNDIDLIARLKYGLLLGVDKGMLHIGTREGTKGLERIRWNSLEKCLESGTLSSREKYYLFNEVIARKNFLLEKGAILLKSNNKEAYLKTHYGTGQWYFAEIGNHGKELHFRPVDESVLRDIQMHYAQSKNFESVVAKLKKSNEGTSNTIVANSNVIYNPHHGINS